ncbi:Threonine synthase 1 [Candidatus Magnetomorum sp. HK-1]|nr:Threonine synthase 1 [Candidatus Magnetomorum sp. HK-1]
MKSELRCIGCGKTYNADEYRVKCDCDEIMEVAHDLKSFERSGEEWKDIFESKKNEVAFKRYKDVLLPDLPDEKIVTLYEGDTPLYRAVPSLSKFFDIDEVYLKHEGLNPTLSFKDRGMVSTISWANHIGAKYVICASTGDTSAAAAAYAAQSDYLKAVVLLPKGQITFEQLSQPIMSGALTLQLDSDFDGCMDVIRALVKKKYPIYLANSMNSFRVEGQKAIGIEMLHQLNWEVPDWIIVPLGNAGNITAIGKGIREIYELGIIDRQPRIAGIQVEAANPIYLSYKEGFAHFHPVKTKDTVANAMRIGNPVSFKKAAAIVRDFGGVVEQVGDEEAMDAKAKVDATGVPICPNSGVGVAGMINMRRKGIIKKTDKVVVALAAHASKFSQPAVEYHKDENSKFGNQVKQLPATLEAVESELNLG